MEGSDAGIYGNHPYAPGDLKLPGFVPGFLSQSTILGVYGVSSLLVVSLTRLFSGLDSNSKHLALYCTMNNQTMKFSRRRMVTVKHNNMATEDLTVQVLNLAPGVTLAELNTFFSYCGIVQQIQLLRDKDQLPYALVTFAQPYAFQTALLLDFISVAERKGVITLQDATFGGQPIGILPAYDVRIPIVSDEGVKDDHTQTKNQLGFIPTANMLRKSPTANILKKSKEEMEEKLKLSEKAGRVLMNQTRSAIYAVEQAAGRMGTALMKNNYVSTGARGFSDALDKVSRSASELGIRKREK